MCGHIGVFGNLTAPDLKFFRNGLVADYVRGVHSTGMAACTPSDVAIHKLAIDPINFLDLSKVKSSINVTQHALIGHNRQATKGKINSVNAHPFQHGSITLVHNGTLTNQWQLEKLFDAPSFDTDSELICWLIDNYELGSVIKSLEGAFALVWWDSNDNSINMINNGEREFNIAVDKDTVYWGSEAKMLDWLLHRAGIAYQDDMKVFSPAIGRYSKFSWTRKDGLSVETEDLELAPEKKPTPRQAKKGAGTKNTGKASDYEALPFKGQADDVPEDLVVGYQNKLLTFKEFDLVLGRGCCVCGCTFDTDTEVADRSVVFVSSDDVVCSFCAASTSTMRYYGFETQMRM